MALDTSQVGSPIFQGLGALAQTNAARRRREDERRQRRGELRGALVGAAAGFAVGGGPQGAAIGAGIGGNLGRGQAGGDPNTVGSVQLGLQAGALQQQNAQTEARAGDIPPEQQSAAPAEGVSGQQGALGFQAGPDFQPSQTPQQARGALSPGQRVRAGALNALNRGDTQQALALGQLAGTFAPSAQSGFTLSAGQQRFDAAGNVVASGGASSESQRNLTFREERNPRTGQLERVAIDPQTGQEQSRTPIGTAPTDQSRTFVVQGGTAAAEQFNIGPDQSATVKTVNGQVEDITLRNQPSASATTAPSGYRFTNEGQGLEFIPGGPADPNAKPADDAIFGGRGISSQDSNNLLELGEKVRGGGFEGLTPLEKQTYTLSYGRVSQPSVVTIGDQTIQRPGLPLEQMGFPPPEAFTQQEQQGGAQGAGGNTQAATQTKDGGTIPLGWKVIGNKPIPVTEAAKLAAVKGSRTAVDGVKAAVIRPDGSIDRTLIGTMQTGLPFTEGRQRAQEMRDALEARLRAESGAAVTESEIDRLVDRFMPSTFDSDEGIRSKFQRMESYIDDTAFLSGRIPESSTGEASTQDLNRRFNLEP